MRIRLALVALGIILAIGGVAITTNQIEINRGNQCTIDQGCMESGPTQIPSLGLGMIVFVLGFVTLVYGYRREENPTDAIVVNHF